MFYRNQVEDSGSVSLLIIKPGLFTAARSKASEIIERLMSSPPSQSGGQGLDWPQGAEGIAYLVLWVHGRSTFAP